MALNEQPCKNCKNYDRIILGDDSTKTRQGWCAAKSLYPAVAMEGQVFPANIRRVKIGELAKPVIVYGSEVVGHCLDFRPKK